MKHLTSLKRLGPAAFGALMVISGVYAKEQLVTRDPSGKVTIETENVQRSGPSVEAGFWAYAGDRRVAVIAMVEGCDQGRGRIKYRKADSRDPDTPLNVRLWTLAGDEVTDKMAAAACRNAKSE
jgi:hypothetical protein